MLKLPLSIKTAILFCLVAPVSVSWSVETKVNQEAARLNNIGVALMDQQLMDKALANFDQAHQADATSATPLLNKGLALIYLRRLPEAEDALQAAAAIEPGSIKVWYSLGVARLGAGEQKPALEAFDKADAIDPQSADISYYSGIIHLAMQDYDPAIADFEKALQLNPLHASAQYGLARALQRKGDSEEARKHLARFQEITQSKIGTLFSANYGEQGHYATAQDMLAPVRAAGAMIPVKFIPTSTAALSREPTPSGACILDLRGTGEKDILTLGNSAGDGENALHAWHVDSAGVPAAIDLSKTGLLAAGHAISCAVGDYDNDGLPDLAVALEDRLLLFHNLGHGKFADSTAAAGLHAMNHPAGITFIDFDHDGDLDLFMTGSALAPNSTKGDASNVLWRNNGNSTFTEWTGPTGLGGNGDTTSAILSDINNDRAVDLVVAGKDPAPMVFENQREGAFKKVPLYSGQFPATRGVVVFDFDKDGWMDVAVTHAGAPGLTLWHNVKGDHFEQVALPMKDAVDAWGLTPIDFDNDSWIDLAAIVQTAQGAKLRIFRNLGPKGFEDVSDAVGAGAIDVGNARTLIAADMDGDGAADLVLPRGAKAPIILHNDGGNRNHSLKIAITGLADNKLGLGTKVDVFSNGAFQKFEVTGSSGYLGQGSTEILAGLGSSEHADVVRMLWPTGVPQDELDLTAAKAADLHELDRRGSSCPVLFAWDGAKYQFVSDVIGAAVVGHWMSPTTRNQSDADEWIKVDGSMLKARNGRLSLRFGEPMEEINYIDRLRLVAIDHPEGTEVFPDERFLSEKPFASGATVVASHQARLPKAAWGDAKEDVLPLLAHRDHQYVRDFHNLSYGGFADEHALTLDLGAWSPARPLRLFLHGFIEYFSASSMYAAWQAGLSPQPPSLEAQLADGSWKMIIADMGFPAGLPRTITVDLTGKLPVGATRIRIRTNLQIYWDQALVDNGPDAASTVRQHELPLSLASVAFRGYPKQVDGTTPGDLTYDYQSISATGPFQWQRGAYTRYGTVTPLLQKQDDQYVIFGSGEEIDAEFSDASLPALPAHWKRDYFFYADGYVKDMDFYEALPFTVAQMPFHGMSGYPYPASEHYPDDVEATKYRLQWNDRFETGDRKQLYQFNYEPALSTPPDSR
jgi:Tfp pilus assembly protein PilF